MATSGRKPTASVIKLVTGRKGRLGVNPAEPKPEGPPSPPVRLTGRAARLWASYIRPAWWLSSADSQKAFMWCHMAEEFEASPRDMTAARIAQLRVLGSELGLDPAARARMATDRKPPAHNPASEFFGAG